MTKKLILAVLSIVAVVAALGTSTYAWFTLSSTATVGTVMVDVEAGDGIELSLDKGSTWKSSYSTKELEDAIKAAYTLANNYDSVPGTDGLESWSFAGMQLTAVTPAAAFASFGIVKPGSVGTQASATVNVNYIEFDIMLRVRGANGVANWVAPSDTTNKPVLKSTGVSWTADQPLAAYNSIAVVSGSTYKAFASNAARISIGGTILEAAASASTAASGTVEAPVAGVFGNSVLGAGASLGLLGAHEYFNLKHPGSITADHITAAKTILSGLNTTPYQEKTVADLLSETATAGTHLQLLDAYTYNADTGWNTTGQLKARIWLEGWDLDCFDAIYADDLTVNLMFTAGTNA